MIKHSSSDRGSVLLGLVCNWPLCGISTYSFKQVFSVPESESNKQHTLAIYEVLAVFPEMGKGTGLVVPVFSAG